MDSTLDLEPPRLILNSPHALDNGNIENNYMLIGEEVHEITRHFESYYSRLCTFEIPRSTDEPVIVDSSSSSSSPSDRLSLE